MSKSGGIDPEKVLSEVYSYVDFDKTMTKAEAISKFFKETIKNEPWINLCADLRLSSSKNLKESVISAYAQAYKDIIRENNNLRLFLKNNNVKQDIPDSSHSVDPDPLDDHRKLRAFLVKRPQLLAHLFKDLAEREDYLFLLNQLLDDWNGAHADPIEEAILRNFDLGTLEKLLKKRDGRPSKKKF